MFSIKKSYRLLLSTLLFIGILLLQFHYHDHGDNTEHCPICIVQEVFDISDTPPAFFLLAFVPFIYIAFLEQNRALPLHIPHTKRSRAPPRHS